MNADSTPPSCALEIEQVLPLAREEIETSRREVETARVRVGTRVVERDEVIDQVLSGEVVDVRRTPVEREIDGPLQPRYEGDVLVIPVVEERLVVRKQLVLKEELRITRHPVERHHRERVTLRSEEPVVKRTAGASPTVDGEPGG